MDPPGLSTSIPPAVLPSGDALQITYDETLDGGSTPDKSAFTIMATPAGGAAASFTPTDVLVVNGSTVLLSFAKPFAHNDTLTLTYTKPSSNPIQDVAGNDAPSITTPRRRDQQQHDPPRSPSPGSTPTPARSSPTRSSA